MASPIRASKRWNGVGYRSSTPLSLVSDGVVTGANTTAVFRANGDGTWSSYKPSRAINGFTTMTRVRAGTLEDAAAGTGNVYLLNALSNFNVSEQVPIATVAEGAGTTPSENADDTTYIHTISGFDRIPNYALHSGTVVNSNGTGGGNWSSGSTWSGGSVPAAGTIVRIRRGDTVTVDGVVSTEYLVVSVENGGTLQHSVAASTELHTQTLQVRETGTYTMGTPASPVPNGTTCKLVLNDASLDTTFDPNQWGNGLVVLGSFTACGYDRGYSLYRSSHERSAGATSITLAAAATNWQAGDRIVIPDTRQLSYANMAAAIASLSAWWSSVRCETRTISSLASGNTVINLSAALTYDHPGPYNEASNLETGVLWHVFNLTRNVVIQSESATGTRGHCVFTGMARVDVRNVLFKDLGRTTSSDLDNTTFDGGGTPTHVGTNQIGKYAAHFHHCGGREPITYGGEPWQFLFLNNAVDGGDSSHTNKWAVTVHGTHWGLVKNNVVYNMFGGAFVLEDGSETGNLLEGNWGVNVPGLGGREDGDDATKGFARQGSALWMRSGLSRFKDNGGANVGAYALVVNAIYLNTINLPSYPGGHLHGGSVSGAVSAPGNRLHLTEFDGFETYGHQMAAATWWWLGAANDSPELSSHRGVIKNFKCWHCTRYGCYQYPSANVTLDGWTQRGDYARLAGSEGDFLIAVWPGDYASWNLTVRDADLQGVYVGIEPSPYAAGWTLLEGCYVRAAFGLFVDTPGAPGAAPDGTNMWPRITRVSDCDLTVTSRSVVGSPSKKEVWLNYWTQYDTANLVLQNDVYVYGRSGSDYRLYYAQQAAATALPQNLITGPAKLVGCPEAGLTNQQAHDKYEPYSPTNGLSTPVKLDNPNPATPGLCLFNVIAPAGASTPSWTNGLVEAL